MLNMALKKMPLGASKKKRYKYGEEFIHQMSLSDGNKHEKVFPSNIKQSNISIGAKGKMKKKEIIKPRNKALSNTKDLTVDEKGIFISKTDERKSNNGMTGDFIIDEFDSKSKPTASLPFEHRYSRPSESSLSNKVSSESGDIQTSKHDGSEKCMMDLDSNNDLSENTHDENCFPKQIKAVFEQSENFVPDIINNNIDVAQKHDDVVPCESEKHLNENNPGKTARTIFTTKMMFQNVVKWALDETFYEGVINHGSYINKISKFLTG